MKSGRWPGRAWLAVFGVAWTMTAMAVDAPALASCEESPGLKMGTGTVLACAQKDGLTIVLVDDTVESEKVVVLRIFGGDGPRWDQGKTRLLLEDVLGVAPATFTRLGEEAMLAVADVNADGLDELAVATFSVNKNLFLYRLDPDPFEFLGRIFFTHAAESQPQALLTALPASTLDLGRTITVTRTDGTYREYQAVSSWDYVLIHDNREE